MIRRPHAYFFLQQVFASQGGIADSTPAGCILGDGTVAPIPGIYLLDSDGRPLERFALARGDRRGELLELLSAN